MLDAARKLLEIILRNYHRQLLHILEDPTNVEASNLKRDDIPPKESSKS